MVLNIIKQTLTEYNLLDKGDKVLIGLSGGADSVCLTHALWALKDELSIELYTAHLNHGIRGKEALRDEKFAQEFSARLGLRYFSKCVSVPELSKQTGKSEETVGREIRYKFFEELCNNYNINKIATAHNKNDNAETIVMNFMRGSSINGLCGIPYKRGNIIRPILNLSRKEIEEYCEENKLQFVTDSTNLTDEYTRNKIRHVLIPLIQKEFNSNFINTVTDNSSLIKEDNEYIDVQALKAYNDAADNGTVEISRLLSFDMPIRRRIIRHMLKNVYDGLNNISAGYVNDILNLITKQSGTRINLSDNVIAKNEYGKLIIEQNENSENVSFEYEFGCKDVGRIEEIKKNITISYTERRNNDNAIYLKCKDTDKIVIRSRRNGDRFYPSGMSGSKKVKEYFIDKKIPKGMRNLIPIIEINGIIAAVGSRIDRRFLFNNKGVRIEFRDF